jgi:argininosuccinate synthase
MNYEYRIVVASVEHTNFAPVICETIELAAQQRGTGIAKRDPAYIIQKMNEGKAVIAFARNKDIAEAPEEFAGFCYIETWSDKQYVAHSGLIVAPQFRKSGLAKNIKKRVFELSREKYPQAKVFGITTSHAVMKINTELGYVPVPFSELTNDDAFWKGCQSCPNYDILTRTHRKMCLCTGMLYDPSKVIMKEKVVLAFSGGLDTSYCAKYLTEAKGYAVHSVIVNTGGFTPAELAEIESTALALGVEKHTTIDETEAFYNECLRFLIYGNILRNGSYPLSVSAERVFQAIAIARYARENKADYIAHGSTGAGNDQVRFDTAFNILLPEVPVLTPIRENTLSRDAEIEFLRHHGINKDWTKAQYSINKGLWGTTVGGVETLTSDQFLPEQAFPTPVTRQDEETITLHFDKGQLVGLNGIVYAHPVKAIQELAAIAQPFGIGRDIHVGDTIIGIKGRVGFEAAAPMIIIKAHHALEKHVLTKHQAALKELLAQQYGVMLHEGNFLEPAMRNIEKFLESTQENVTGTVKVYCAPYRFHIIGVNSPNDLMSARFGKYGEINTAWTGEDVRGFARIASNQSMIYYSVNGAPYEK